MATENILAGLTAVATDEGRAVIRVKPDEKNQIEIRRARKTTHVRMTARRKFQRYAKSTEKPNPVCQISGR